MQNRLISTPTICRKVQKEIRSSEYTKKENTYFPNFTRFTLWTFSGFKNSHKPISNSFCFCWFSQGIFSIESLERMQCMYYWINKIGIFSQRKTGKICKIKQFIKCLLVHKFIQLKMKLTVPIHFKRKKCAIQPKKVAEKVCKSWQKSNY